MRLLALLTMVSLLVFFRDVEPITSKETGTNLVHKKPAFPRYSLLILRMLRAILLLSTLLENSEEAIK
jgi:hypothetical protein